MHCCLTFVKSTPVKACTDGGIWLTNFVTSAESWSVPPINTMSSVLARGAETSAAIYNTCKISF